MRVTILGCGASGGVPLIGCQCEVCQSDNLKNTRTRASILIEKGSTALLVDMSPDLRQQALRHKIHSINAVLMTHAHADHCHGIDDVRAFNFHANQPLDLYAHPETLEELKRCFHYAFREAPSHPGWYRPAFTTHEIPDDYVTEVAVSEELKLTIFRQIHGQTFSLGLRIGDFAYSTDVNVFPDAVHAQLEGLDTWVIDCLRYKPAPTHAHLDLTLEWITRFKPRRAILTHMGHELEYDALSHSLPPHVQPAYDGLVLEMDV